MTPAQGCRTGPPGYIGWQAGTPGYIGWQAGTLSTTLCRARICRRLWTLRHRFQESIPTEKLILKWILNLFPNRFQESIFHPLTRLQIPAQESTLSSYSGTMNLANGSWLNFRVPKYSIHGLNLCIDSIPWLYELCMAFS